MMIAVASAAQPAVARRRAASSGVAGIRSPGQASNDDTAWPLRTFVSTSLEPPDACEEPDICRFFRYRALNSGTPRSAAARAPYLPPSGGGEPVPRSWCPVSSARCCVGRSGIHRHWQPTSWSECQRYTMPEHVTMPGMQGYSTPHRCTDIETTGPLTCTRSCFARWPDQIISFHVGDLAPHCKWLHGTRRPFLYPCGSMYSHVFPKNSGCPDSAPSLTRLKVRSGICARRTLRVPVR